MSILKWQAIPPQMVYPSSVSRKITPLYFFSSNDIYFAQKESIKVKIFKTFKCSSQNLSNSLYMSILKWQAIPLQMVYPSSVSRKITPLYFFSSNNIYFAHKEPIKVKIFETFRCLGQNSSNSWHVNFEMTSQFLLKFYIPLQFHER